MKKTEWLAIVLAEGCGTRLEEMTKELPKPAVPFGGQYRLIDFTLSNCRHSGIDTVGITTQYQPMLLHAYLGQGGAWDLDTAGRGVHILPPCVREDGSHWYQGPADAVYQNRDFIEHYRPEYVVVLSGDHIYKLDYAAMLDYHKICRADATIGAVQVPRTGTGQHTVIETSDTGRIISVGDKPYHPQTSQVSMGVYIFSWKVLKQFLTQAAAYQSGQDFNRDIIPGLLAAGGRLYAYRFQGYWKDAGTMESYWEASMDLLGDAPRLLLHDPDWPVYSPQLTMPPHYHGPAARVCGSLIAGGAVVLGEVENSIIFSGVYIGPGANVRDSVVMHQARLESGISLRRAIVLPRTVLSAAAVAANRTEGVIPVTGSQAQVSLAG